MSYVLKDTKDSRDRFYVTYDGIKGEAVTGTRGRAAVLPLDIAKSALKQLKALGFDSFEIFPASQYPSKKR